MTGVQTCALPISPLSITPLSISRLPAGASMFGARAYANNFTEEELLEAIDFAHLRGVKVYLTVNTLIKNSEFSKLYDYLLVYYKRGLDAVIVQIF